MSTQFESESFNPLSVFFEAEEGETRGRKTFRPMRAPVSHGRNRFDFFKRNRKFLKRPARPTGFAACPPENGRVAEGSEMFEFLSQPEFPDNEFGLASEYEDWQSQLNGNRSRRRRNCNCHQNRSDSSRSKFGAYNSGVLEQGEGAAFEYEFNSSDFPSSIVALMRMGLAGAGLRLAIVFGFRNEGQLTDLAFHARHPERLGRGITASETNSPNLVNEWMSIRDTVVRPVLRDTSAPAATGFPPSAPTSTFQPAIGNKAGKGCKQDLCDPAYVRWVQQSLNQILGLRLTENGHTDGNTWSAIGRFQKKSGLKVDFTVGPNTRQAFLAAGASQPPPLKDLPCGPTSGPDLARLLNKYRVDIPLHFLLGWIEVESGRRIDSSTYLCERGYFQIHPDQSKDLGWNHEPLSYDPDYSIKRGVELVRAMVRATEKLATKYGVSKASDAFWGLVKMYHWIPSSPEKILAHMSSRGRRPTSWAAIMQYIVGEKTPIPALGTWDPIEGATNADKTLEKAKMWKTALPNNGSN